MSDEMKELLSERLAEEGMAPEIPVSVAELHRRLLPYSLCRERLGFAGKGEYDMGFLTLLVDGGLHVSEAALLDAVRSELGSPEPGLALLQRFAASEVRLRARKSDTKGRAGKTPPAEARGVEPVPTEPAETGPPIAALETGRSRGDYLPGLDDPLLVPQDESADALGRQSPAAGVPEEGGGGPSTPCRSCRSPLPDRSGVRFCPQCGADQERWPCPTCGEEVERGWSYCALCGKMLPK
jgi:predicted RNA-binding Zn-ribbon protein involved in translation (DUF1610 family)